MKPGKIPRIIMAGERVKPGTHSLSKIEVYTTTYCPYCRAAEALLDRKEVKYKKIDVTHDLEAKLKVMKQFNWRTVPIIIINDKVIGGYDQLAALEKADKLDDILNPTK